MIENRNIPDLILERYLLCDLPDHKMKKITELEKSDKDVSKRIKALKTSNKKVFKQYPTEEIVNQIMARFRDQENSGKAVTKQNRIKFILFPSILSAAAAMIFVFFFMINSNNSDQDIIVTTTGPDDKVISDAKLIDTKIKPIDIARVDHGTTRLRGFVTKLYVYRKHGKDIELLNDNSTGRINDLIQLAYAVTKDTFGIIFSIDGRGNVTKHFPINSLQAAKMKPGRKFFLSHSFQLDDAPEFERFFMVTSDSQFNGGYIITLAKQLAINKNLAKSNKIPVNGSFEQVSILLIKPEKK